MNNEVTIQVSPWLAKKKGLLAREFKGIIEKETSKAVFVKGHLYCKPTSTCMRCGRLLTNPISLKVGFGPVCSAELGIPWIASEEEIEHFIKKIEEIKYEGWFPKGMIKIIGDYTVSNPEEEEEMVFVEGIKVKGYNRQAEKPPRKRVDIEDNQLEIYFPYDEHLITIMREHHGSFNRKKKCWVFSVSFDLIKSLMEELKDEQFAFSFDLLEQLKVIKEKEEKSRELSKASSSDFTIPGLKQELYPFQRAGVEFIELHNGRALVADEMGCISGEAIITINRAGCSKKMKMRELYAKFNHISGSWRDDIPTMTRCFINGEFRLRQILGVYAKGIKKTVRITTESGKSIDVTPDHLILTTKGWLEAEKLKEGDIVLTNGQMVCKICGSNKEIITYQWAKFRGYCKKCMYRLLRKNPSGAGKYISKTDGYIYVTGGVRNHPYKPKTEGIPEHRLVVEAAMNHLTLEEWLDIIKHGTFTEEHIFLPPYLQVHHKNGIKTDNRLENLMVVDGSLHHKLEGRHKNLPIFKPNYETITRIEEGLEIDVYDITVEEGHNFVANGIVVHNCGKSAQSLAWLQLHPELRPAVILCPAFLKLNWEREINKWLPATDYNRYVILEGTPDPIKLQLISDSSPSIFIINYDILNRWLEFLKNLKIKVLVCDEIHYIKNSKAQRTKATLNLGKGIPYIIGLSGTPLINRPIELWTTLNLITPGQWGNLISYAKKYCNAYHNGFGWDFTGASNLDELNDKLRQRLMIRRIKSDVLKELPPKQRTPLYVEITNYKEYKLLEMDFSKWLQQQGFSREEIIRSLLGRALSKIEYMKQVCIKGKLDTIVQWIEDFLSITEEKLVVFTHHRDVATSIGKKFKDLSVVLLGEEDKKKRDEKVTRFQTNNNCRLFIGSMQATGMGINLTASSTVVFTELGWTPGLHEQCEDRCHRIGSDTTKPINIYYFLGKNTIDERIYDLLQKKSEILRSTLGDEYKNDDLNLVAEVIKSYL